MSVDSFASGVLDELRERGTHRRMRILDGAQSTRMTVDGRDVLLFAGSNYLDLAHHPAVVEASAEAARARARIRILPTEDHRGRRAFR